MKYYRMLLKPKNLKLTHKIISLITFVIATIFNLNAQGRNVKESPLPNRIKIDGVSAVIGDY